MGTGHDPRGTEARSDQPPAPKSPDPCRPRAPCHVGCSWEPGPSPRVGGSARQPNEPAAKRPILWTRDAQLLPCGGAFDSIPWPDAGVRGHLRLLRCLGNGCALRRRRRSRVSRAGLSRRTETPHPLVSACVQRKGRPGASVPGQDTTRIARSLINKAPTEQHRQMTRRHSRL